MTIDLTPAELREFAKSEGLASFELNDIQRRAWSRLCSHDARFPLALALADAMEEIAELKGNSVHADAALDAEGYKKKCEQLEADLEAARISQGTLNAAIRTGIEQESIILQLEADLEAARKAIRACVTQDQPPVEHLPAVRAAWEGK